MIILSGIVRGVLDIDERETWREAGKYKAKIVTSGLGPRLVSLKMKVYGLFEVPPKLYTVTRVEEVRRNPMFKRFNIEVECPDRLIRRRLR